MPKRTSEEIAKAAIEFCGTIIMVTTRKAHISYIFSEGKSECVLNIFINTFVLETPLVIKVQFYTYCL